MKTGTKASVFLLVALLCFPVLFAACGSGGDTASPQSSAQSSAAAEAQAWDQSADYAVEDAEIARAADESGIAGIPLPAGRGAAALSEKIIYSAEANIETTDLAATTEKIYDLLERYDAFIENSYIGGRERRSANFTLRVPREHFTALTADLPQLGNLLSVSSNAVNIQERYTDTESRLKTYRTEEERLLSMLASVKDVESMIAIESRLSDVRYELEALTARLRDWDNQVNYSSVSLYIDEVKQLQAQLQEGGSYAQELKAGFVGTLRGVAAFFMELFKFAVIFLPVIVLIAVIALAVFFIVKRLRSRAEKRGERPSGKRLGKPGDAGRGKEAAAPEAPKQGEDAKQAPERDGAD